MGQTDRQTDRQVDTWTDAHMHGADHSIYSDHSLVGDNKQIILLIHYWVQ